MRRLALALGLALSACTGGDPSAVPVEQQAGLLGSSVQEPARRASRILETLKAAPMALLQTCLERYRTSTPSGPDWRLAAPLKVAMTSTADQASDGRARQANPDGWIDRGELRSEIVPADGDPAKARCLVCRYDLDDGRSDPLTLFGVDTTGNCR